MGMTGLAGVRDTAVVAQHWYDPLTISQKRWIPNFTIQLNDIFKASYKSIIENISSPAVLPVFGANAAVACHEGAIVEPLTRTRKAFIANAADEYLVPAIVGETGVPFNCVSTLGSKLNDDGYTAMLDRTMKALDNTFSNFTLWNYTPTNDAVHGDLWNREDLSVFHAEHNAPLASRLTAEAQDIFRPLRGGRALVRPYAVKIHGKPVSQKFDIASQRYDLTFESLEVGSCVIFVPTLHFSEVEVLGSEAVLKYEWDASEQVLRVTTGKGVARVVLQG